MPPGTGIPANDPRAPARPLAAGPTLEARLKRLMADRRMQRLLRDDGPPRELVLRMAQALRRELEETEPRR